MAETKLPTWVAVVLAVVAALAGLGGTIGGASIARNATQDQIDADFDRQVLADRLRHYADFIGRARELLDLAQRVDDGSLPPNERGHFNDTALDIEQGSTIIAFVGSDAAGKAAADIRDAFEKYLAVLEDRGQADETKTDVEDAIERFVEAAQDDAR